MTPDLEAALARMEAEGGVMHLVRTHGDGRLVLLDCSIPHCPWLASWDGQRLNVYVTSPGAAHSGAW